MATVMACRCLLTRPRLYPIAKAIGSYRLPLRDSAQVWRSFSTTTTSAAQDTAATATKKDEDDKPVKVKDIERTDLKRLYDLAMTEKKLLAGSLALLVASSSATLVFPAAIGSILDITMSDDSNVSLTAASLGLTGLFSVHATMMAFRSMMLTKAGEAISARMRQSVFRSILQQDTSFFDRNATGELVNRLSADCNLLQAAVTSSLSQGLRSLFLGAGSLGMMAYLSPQLLMVAVGVFPPVVGTSIYLSRKMKKQQAQVQDALAQATRQASDSLANIRLVREFGSEANEERLYRHRITDAYKLAVDVGRSVAILEGVVFFGANMSLVAVLAYGGHMVLNQSLTVGGLTSFLLYSLYLGIHAASASRVYSDLVRSIGASKKLFNLMNLPPSSVSSLPASLPSLLDSKKEDLFEEASQSWIGSNASVNAAGHDNPDFAPSTGLAIRMQNVTFAYPQRPEANVLQQLQLDIPSGAVVGFCGESGCGKSTIARLLTKMYEPTEGKIYINGFDMHAELSAQQLRRHMGVVSQEALLFDRSVRENLLYGHPEATEEDMMQAAKDANAHGFITELPDGYESHIGERGITLSGGERSRLAIARALLKQPSLLILDEASAALDAVSEAQVHEAIHRALTARHGMTAIMIAHRLTTLRQADVIYAMQSGRIVEQGTYDQLSRANGLFASMLAKTENSRT
eukprot:TRINITY_DN12490_c0_g2_i3.p1 TRINITY_DN12490_c0_g2~~TRINITY_DN12490_c0_g2_i3.p1  ORF type:complete len:689 (+),score=161.85 TRINITY_DN12490_c0_g2_i3:1072-3138(+)